MDEDLSDQGRRVVLVTGAGKGLGRAFALAWAGRGARLVVNNRRRDGAPDSARHLAQEIRAAGGQAVADDSDVRSPNAGQQMVAGAMSAYGRLDAVILNAGITGLAARFPDPAMDNFKALMELNFFANIGIIQAALPPLRAAGAGRLLLVSSSAGLYGLRGRAPYAASKGALTALALTLATELRRDAIGVNVLTPFAMTQMTAPSLKVDVGDNFTAERAAPMALWLTSAACRQTGEIWTAGGGYFRRGRMTEGSGAAASGGDPVTPEWVGANIDRLGEMQNGIGFSDAEAAFADLVSRLAALAD